MKKRNNLFINTISLALIMGIIFGASINEYNEKNIGKKDVEVVDENKKKSQDLKTVLVENISKENRTIYTSYPKEDVLKEYKGYEVCAKLEIPIIDLETYVLKNYSQESLKVSVTKYFGPNPNEKGNFSSYDQVPVACLIASGVLEMYMAKCISIEKKRLSIADKLPESMEYLKSLYDMIEQENANRGKPVKAEKIVEKYTGAFTDKKLRELTNAIVQSMDEDIQSAEKAGKGKYIPKREILFDVTDNLRTDLLRTDLPSKDAIVFADLLDRAGHLKEYLSKYEMKELKKRLHEIRKNKDEAAVKKTIRQIDELVDILVSAGGIFSDV